MSDDSIVFSRSRLAALQAALEGLASGDFDRRLPISPAKDELDALALAMNVVAEELAYASRQQIDRLAAAKDSAEQASLLKSTFLANLSHEIRTPMTAILGFAELLQDEGLPAERRTRHLGRLAQNGRLLLHLVDDLLDLAQIESGRLDVVLQEVETAELVQSVSASLESLAAAKGLPLVVECLPGVPRTVVVDPLRARQVLLNVVGNAVKFTRAGAVTVAVAYDRGRLIVDVSDTGIGIPEAKQARLFQAFFQSDPTVRARYGGSGLGLAVAREMARALGGDLVLVRSAPGSGSVFRLTLVDHGPDRATCAAAPAADGEPGADALAGLRLLVAEDTPDSAEWLELVLKGGGATVVLTTNGEEAVATALGGEFDVLLLDVRMPVMDGAQATAMLRARGYKGRILGLTAHASQAEIKKYLGLGFDEVLTKPILRGALLAAVAKAARGALHGDHEEGNS